MADAELTVSNLSVARGGRPVLRDVSLGILPGEITALLGANGAGKSTLVLTIAGVLPAFSGAISCDGVKLLGQSPDSVRRHGVGVTHQKHDGDAQRQQETYTQTEDDIRIVGGKQLHRPHSFRCRRIALP